jgi:hypothetical protein
MNVVHRFCYEKSQSSFSNRKLFVAALLAYWACVPVRAGEIINGITELFVDVKLGSSAAGIIRTEFFKEGDLVQKGTVILELDKTSEELETTRRQLIMTRNKTDMQSTRTLLNTSVVSREEMLKKETEFRVSEAEYGMAFEQLAKRRIATPFSGCVVELLLHAGEACEPYEPLVRVVASEHMARIFQTLADILVRFEIAALAELRERRFDLVERGIARLLLRGETLSHICWAKAQPIIRSLRSTANRLHQVVETREGVELSPPDETLARLSFQRFFRLFRKLSGMTGTAREAAAEF